MLFEYIKKKKGTIKYLGCSIEQIIKWLEFNFDENMTWENRGSYWHCDHTLPIKQFNMENEDEIMVCFNWKNIMPMYAPDNISKSAKIVFEQTTMIYTSKHTMQLPIANQKQESQLNATRPNCGNTLRALTTTP